MGEQNPVLDEIRDRDTRWSPYRPQNTVADYDRRELLGMLDALRTERDRLAKDAARYQWLRHHLPGGTLGDFYLSSPESIDEAIDAELSAAALKSEAL
jgi:hypothetical protein